MDLSFTVKLLRHISADNKNIFQLKASEQLTGHISSFIISFIIQKPFISRNYFYKGGASHANSPD